ncbi:MAG: MFS transporter [Pseudomonadales bacterium]|nr:MFS transporter [Pseudomonadales bacterium]
MGPGHRGGVLNKDLHALERDRRTDLLLYLVGTGSWFTSNGIQMVLFAWLVTVRLHESPEKVGFAQSMMLMPMLFLLLVGGAASDRLGGARLARIAQGLALLPVAGLAFLLAGDVLAYGLLVVYALLMGAVGAFVTPARDGLLSQIAGTRIQRAVVLASLVQFAVQIVGFQLAGAAEVLGPVTVLGVQLLVLAVGAGAFVLLERRLRHRVAPVAQQRIGMGKAIGEGLATVLASPAMRSVAVLNVLVGLFYMGAFQVGLPLLLREVHGAAPTELAQLNTVHMLGVVVTTVWLLRMGDVERRGRALIVGVVLGGVGLTGIALAGSFPVLLVFNFCWGVTGGMVMAMARTIMQEAAPADARGRVMAFFSLTLMGAGPLGALFSGLLVEHFGAQLALLFPALVMMACGLLVALLTRLWELRPATT